MTYAVRVHDQGHPAGKMTTFELRNLRRELLHALEVLPEGDRQRGCFAERLAQVKAEEAGRQKSGHPILP